MMRLLNMCAIGFSLIVGGCATPPTRGDATPPASTGPSVVDRATPATERTPTGGEAYHDLIPYRAKDAKPAIVEPVMLPAREAMLAAGTKVIGIFVNEEARAYPLFILNNHQIVNDMVGGTPVSASW